MRRLTPLAAALTTSACLLSACAGTGTEPAGPATKEAAATADAPVTLEFWSNHPGNSKDIEEKIIADFEAQNPTIKVSLVDAGKNYEEVAQKFNAALAGGQVPDLVVVSDVTWFNFVLNDQLAPLDKLLKDVGGTPDDYISNFYDEYERDGNHYAVPYSRSTPLFYYNKDLFAKAGLPDRGPKTWQEWNDDFAPKLKDSLGAGIAPLTIPDGSNYMDWYFQGMIWALGGHYSKDWEMTLSSPESVKAGEYLQKQFKEGYFKAAKDATTPFLAQRTAAILESTGSLGGIVKAGSVNFGTAFLPSVDGKPGCPTGGAGIAIPAKSTKQEAAAKFLAFATNTENAKVFSQGTGYMPVRTSTTKLPEVQKYMADNPNFATAIQQLPHTQAQDAARVFVPGGARRIGAALDKIAQGANVEETFRAVDEEQQRLIDSSIKPKLGK